MIGVALALILLGILLSLLTIIWVGIPVAVVGLALVFAYLAGIGRRAAQERP